MKTNKPINNFIGGEVSPKLSARSDSDLFARSVARCENFIPQTQGGAKYRLGTRQVHNTRFGLKAILVPFQYSDTQAYLLELTNQAMRFYKDNTVITKPSKAITGITKANPAVVTVVGHGMTTGREIYIDNVVGMTEVNKRFFNITVLSVDTFSISHPVTGTGENSTNYTTYSSGGTSLQVYEIPTPFTVDSLLDLRWAQSGDFEYFFSRQYETRKLTRTAHTLWSLATYVRTADFQTTARRYPRAGCFTSDSRLAAAGSADFPETIYGSMTPNSSGNRYDNYTIGTGASDAFSYTKSPTLNKPDVIQWIANLNKKIIIGAYSSICEGRGASDDESMSPLGVDIRPISEFGAENAVPISSGSSLYYIQRTAQKIRSIDYDLNSQGYVNNDRTKYVEHLAKPGFINMVMCKGEPDILWSSLKNGKMAGMTTYMGIEEATGWGRHYIAGHHINDDGVIVPWARVLHVGQMERPGNQDQLWLVVERLSCDKEKVKTITGISKAALGVVTSNSHGLSVGNIVHIAGVVGMTELNNNYYKITATTTNTFTLDVNTSNFTTYSSGGTASVAYTNRTIEYVVDEPDYPDRSDFYSEIPDDPTLAAAVIAADDARFLSALYEAQKGASHLDHSLEYDGSLLGANTVKLNVALAAVNAKTIQSVTQANPGVFTTSTAHGFISGDWVEFTGMLGMTAFNGLCLPVVVTSSTQFNLAINTSALPAYTANSGTVTRRGVGIPVTSPVATQNIRIHTATAHGLTAGQRIYISGINGTEELNNNYYLVNAVDNTNAFSLLIDNTNTPVTNETAFTQYTSGGTVQQFGVSITPGAVTGTGITFTADFAIFTASMVNRYIVKAYDKNGYGGGIAQITGFTNSTTVTCSIVSNFDNKQAIPGGKWYLTTNSITALQEFAGQLVDIVCDGGQVASQVVPATGVLSVTESSRVIVGKRYRGIIETLNLDMGGVTGSAQSKKRNISHYAIRFLNSLGSFFGSLGTFFGTTQYRKERIQFQATWDLLGRPTPPFTGTKIGTFDDSWEDENKKALIMHDAPMPCTITCIEVFANTTDEN